MNLDGKKCQTRVKFGRDQKKLGREREVLLNGKIPKRPQGLWSKW
jgi:hypothetical protein